MNIIQMTENFKNKTEHEKRWLFGDKSPVYYVKNKKELKFLIENGFDINEKDKTGKNALFYVPSEAAAEILIKHGIKVNHFLEKRKKPFNNPNIEKLIEELSVKEQQIDLEKLLNNNNSNVKKKRI